jgi:hypothetical protein
MSCVFLYDCLEHIVVWKLYKNVLSPPKKFFIPKNVREGKEFFKQKKLFSNIMFFSWKNFGYSVVLQSGRKKR